MVTMSPILVAMTYTTTVTACSITKYCYSPGMMNIGPKNKETMLRQQEPPAFTSHSLPVMKFIGKFVGRTTMAMKTELLSVTKRVNSALVFSANVPADQNAMRPRLSGQDYGEPATIMTRAGQKMNCSDK